jgi:hypothetical protein
MNAMMLGAAGLLLAAFGKAKAPAAASTAPKPPAKPPKSTAASAAPPPPPGTVTLIKTPDGTAPTAANTALASQRAAALGLADYLRRGGDPGRKGAASSYVKQVQAAMGMPKAQRDGIYGPITQARAAALGASMPAPPATVTTPKPAPAPAAAVVTAPKPAQKPPVAVATPKPAPAPPKAAAAAVKPAAPKPAAKPAAKPVAKRSPKQAALELQSYLSKGGAPGSKGKPAAAVRDAQRDMGMVAKEQDGIVGPHTRAAAKSLGVTLPEPKASPAKAAPATKKLAPVAKAKRAPKQAALDLANYVKQSGAQLGNRNRPSQIVHDAQVDMLMPVTQVDGIYGPVTAARGKALGVAMPARPK